MIQLDRIHTSSTRFIPFLKKKQVSGYQYHKMTNLLYLGELVTQPRDIFCSLVELQAGSKV